MENHHPRPHGTVPDDEIDLREVWNLFLRNRWLIGGCTFVVVVLAAMYVLLTPPVYEASVSIRIDEDRSALGMLSSFDMLSSSSEIGTEMEVLRSRTIAESVVDELGLQLSLQSPGRVARGEIFTSVRVDRLAPEAAYRARLTDDGRFSVENRTTDTHIGTFAPGEPIGLDGASVTLSPNAIAWEEIEFAIAPFPVAVKALREALTVRQPNREANVAVVHFESRDTILVHQIPNAVARSFIASRREVKKTEARSTVDFLREQIDTITRQLGSAEEMLRAFREVEQVVSLETQAQMQVSHLAQLQAQRDQLEAERTALAALLEEVEANAAQSPTSESPYRRLVAFPSLFRNQATAELLRSLTAAENERVQLLHRFKDGHPDVKILTARIRELEDQLRSIATTYLQGLQNQVASLDATLVRFGEQLEKIPAKEVQFARLQRHAKVLEEIYVLLQTRLKESEIAEAVEDPSVRVVDPAVRSIEPVSPRPLVNLALALVFGTILGVCIAFVREFMDTTVHTREDVNQLTGAPVLGQIPRIRDIVASANGQGPAAATNARPSQFELRLITGRDPRNPVSEAYRSLRTNITFSQPDRPPRAIVFTSPLPGDGKSTSAANLAVTLAQQGQRVLLIDADLRRGSLNSVFGVGREPGLSNVLLQNTDTTEAIRQLDVGDNITLDFMPTGTLPPNPAELVGSKRMHALLQRLEETYDAIIMDAPPLNLVTDAALLGTNADGVVVVARANRTQKAAIQFAVEQLRNVRAPILGAVLNDVDYKRGAHYGAYGAYYHYYYGPSDS